MNYKEILLSSSLPLLLLLLYATFCSVRARVSVCVWVCLLCCVWVRSVKGAGGVGGVKREAVSNAAKFHCILLGPCDKLIWICVCV